jgi:hypothetical protein
MEITNSGRIFVDRRDAGIELGKILDKSIRIRMR